MHPRVKTFPSDNDFRGECSQGIHGEIYSCPLGYLSFRNSAGCQSNQSLEVTSWGAALRLGSDASVVMAPVWKMGQAAVRSQLFLKHSANERNLPL